MNHLVVVSHPNEHSLTMGLARAYAAELESLGHTVRMHDLYRGGFNPVLAAPELIPAGPDRPAGADVLQAQEDIRQADVVTLVYPVWWSSMPAMLKGYVDRVFAFGFAYDIENGLLRGKLSGKKVVLITVSGAPRPVLVEDGTWDAMQLLTDNQLFAAVGCAVVEHLHFGGILPGLPAAVAEQHLERVRACARQHGSTEA